MGRLPRRALPDGWYHVWARGVASTTAFPDGEHRDVFLRFAWAALRRLRIRCEALTVMSTHCHFVLAAPVERLSKAMHSVNWRYATYFNARHDSFGHVFAERFQTRAIEGEADVYDRCEYVLQNPVKAGLCERAEDWPWSWCRYWH